MTEDAGTAPFVERNAKIGLGVIVERRRSTSPWQDYAWLPIGVVAGGTALEPWSTMHETPEAAQFFAGEYQIELNSRETGNYQINLAVEQPAVYIVLRFDETAPLGIRVQLVTVSPAEAQGYLESSADIVERVPMPTPVAEILRAYVATYHVEQPFYKRQRRNVDPRKVGFGQQVPQHVTGGGEHGRRQ